MQSLAIIGSGISGLGAAYFLRDKFKLSLFEKEHYIGGHTNTVTVIEGKQELAIDTAFMVYNETTYPLLTRLFKELKVETKPAPMSFSVQHVPTGLEFCGTGLNGLFAQRRNLWNIPYIKMLLEINRFNQEAVEVLDLPQYAGYSLAAYVKEKGYSRDFVQKFLVPMSSAVWSTPPDVMLDFPARTLVQFFKNHCFLGLKDHLSWRTCVGGSRQYRDKLLSELIIDIHPDRMVTKVIQRQQDAVVVDSKGIRHEFDKVLIAAHADDALAMLDNPTRLQKDLLSLYPYQDNHCFLHTDERVMPKTRGAWSSWNYRIQEDRGGQPETSTVYYMNSLQGVSKKTDYFISVNDSGLIDPKKIIWHKTYRHPVFTVEGQKNQHRLQELNQDGPVYFSGAYFRYGFHEDGLMSAMDAARAISKDHIWD